MRAAVLALALTALAGGIGAQEAPRRAETRSVVACPTVGSWDAQLDKRTEGAAPWVRFLQQVRCRQLPPRTEVAWVPVSRERDDLVRVRYLGDPDDPRAWEGWLVTAAASLIR